jgi:hypothetical protein
MNPKDSTKLPSMGQPPGSVNGPCAAKRSTCNGTARWISVIASESFINKINSFPTTRALSSVAEPEFSRAQPRFAVYSKNSNQYKFHKWLLKLLLDH